MFGTELSDMADYKLQAVRFPLRSPADHMELELELCKLRTDELVKVTHGSQMSPTDIVSFWLDLSVTHYPRLMKNAKLLLVQFGSTYSCESGFSLLPRIKDKYRNRLSNAHVKDNMLVNLVSYVPRYRQLIENN